MEVIGGPVFAVGEDGIIIRTTDNGSTWDPVSSPTIKTLRAISDFGFMSVGDSGTIIKSTDNGVTWSTRNSGTF
ncbi:MAG: WD40/YVTN/BNR-like repeat-containing protein [Bacteroidota bacterium]